MADGRDRKRGRKRRYRLRRYRKELRYLRPVTPEILRELDTRAPDSAGGAREVTCFALWNHGPTDGEEQLVVVAFGYDGTCYVLNLRYEAGGGYDVERIPHKIDLGRLKTLIARRSTRWRHHEGNDLAAQLLIRFIVDINNKLGRENGAYLQFRDAALAAEPMWDRMPAWAIRKRLKRGLEAIMRTDPDIPSSWPVKVSVYFGNEAMLADYEDLRRHLLEDGELDFNDQGVFSGEKALLTERFVALAWLAFDEFQSDDLVASTLSKMGSGDTDRVGGWTGDETEWAVHCRIPSARSRRRARSRFRKWIRRALANFEQRHLDHVIWDLDIWGVDIWDLDWAVAQSKRHDARRQKLLAWAERRWQAVKEEQVSALKRRLDQERDNDARWIQLYEESVGKYRKLVGVIRGFATSAGSGRHCHVAREVAVPLAEQ